MRGMDIADRHPALTLKELMNLEFAVRKLFCEAYIMLRPEECQANLTLDAPQGSRTTASLESTGGPLTLTSVVFDQLKDMTEYRCGQHSHLLFALPNEHRVEVETSLASLATLVDDCFSRLRADFGDEDLYMCFEVMDWRCWHAHDKSSQAFTALRQKRCACARPCMCNARGNVGNKHCATWNRIGAPGRTACRWTTACCGRPPFARPHCIVGR